MVKVNEFIFIFLILFNNIHNRTPNRNAVDHFFEFIYTQWKLLILPTLTSLYMLLLISVSLCWLTGWAVSHQLTVISSKTIEQHTQQIEKTAVPGRDGVVSVHCTHCFWCWSECLESLNVYIRCQLFRSISSTQGKFPPPINIHIRILFFRFYVAALDILQFWWLQGV